MHWLYLGAAHIALLAWFWHELWALPDGNAYVTVAWGAYGIAIVATGSFLGRDKPHMTAVYSGVATLFLVVAKLFLVDLVELDPLFRVLLFLGLGSAFLLLSYFFQNVISGKSNRSARAHPGRLQ
jgi:uncharacterized membrane protein